MHNEEWWEQNDWLSLWDQIQRARKHVGDTEPILGTSVPRELLEEYSECECLRCHLCNEQDPRQYAPYMAWSDGYVYVVNTYYEDRDHYNKIMIFTLSSWGTMYINDENKLVPTGVPLLYGLPAGYVPEENTDEEVSDTPSDG